MKSSKVFFVGWYNLSVSSAFEVLGRRVDLRLPNSGRTESNEDFLVSFITWQFCDCDLFWDGEKVTL